MAVLIKDTESSLVWKTILYTFLIAVIVVIAYMLWTYVISRYIRGEIFAPTEVACTVAPETPTDFTVTPSSNTAIVEWSEVSNVDNYILYLGTVPNFDLVLAERTITVIGNSIAVLNLIPITYYFKVAAVNSCGTSDLSVEKSVTITDWPEQLKICKKDDLSMCIHVGEAGEEIGPFVTDVCVEGNCNLTYFGEEFIKRFDKDVCIAKNNTGGTVIEEAVSAQECTSPTIWEIDLATGRITTQDGLCLGSYASKGNPVFNTTCSVISNPDDARYLWVVQAL